MNASSPSSKNTRWLWAIVLISLIANGYQAFRLSRYHQADLVRKAKRIDRVGSRAEFYKHLPMDTSDIVLFGDSHFEQFPASELLGMPTIRNRGLSGQSTSDLLLRVDDVLRGAPRKVVLCVGINDINLGRSPAQYARNMAELLDRLLSGLPIDRILVLAIPPNGNAGLQKKVIIFNEGLAELCAKRNLTLLDPGAVLGQGGALKAAYTFDGLHLNAEGYLRFAAWLRPHL